MLKDFLLLGLQNVCGSDKKWRKKYHVIVICNHEFDYFREVIDYDCDYIVFSMNVIDYDYEFAIVIVIVPTITPCLPRIGLESLLEHFIFLNFLGGGPPNPPQGEVATRKYSHHKFRTHDLQTYIHPCYDRSNCITVYKYECDKYMLVCANERS